MCFWQEIRKIINELSSIHPLIWSSECTLGTCKKGHLAHMPTQETQTSLHNGKVLYQPLHFTQTMNGHWCLYRHKMRLMLNRLEVTDWFLSSLFAKKVNTIIACFSSFIKKIIIHILFCNRNCHHS